MLNEYGVDEVITSILDSYMYDWYIVPVVIPDGYNDTHSTVSH